MKTGLIFLSACFILVMSLPVIAADKTDQITYILFEEKQSIPEMKLPDMDFGETTALSLPPTPELILQKGRDAKHAIPSLLGGYNML